jgi:hypothetical protein
MPVQSAFLLHYRGDDDLLHKIMNDLLTQSHFVAIPFGAPIDSEITSKSALDRMSFRIIDIVGV